MNVSAQSFRFSCVSSSDSLAVPSVSELLAKVRTSPPWDEVSIFPVDEQYPRLHLAWQNNYGYILHCFDDAESLGGFLVESATFGTPEVEINLAGQALERWPRQLFVAERLAHDAIEFFLRTGARDPSRHWAGTGEFPRETVWEGRKEREAWESRVRGSDA